MILKYKSDKVVIYIHKKVAKFCLCHGSLYEKLESKLLSAHEYGNKVDTKPLKNKKDLWRLRINDYRFIYTKEGDKLVVISVLAADNRGDIY